MNENNIPRPRLLSIATAVPPYRLNQSDVVRHTTKMFGASYSDFERFVPVYENSAIKTRYSCVPIDWYSEPHGLKDRNALYVENAVNLLEEAAERALQQAKLAASDIDAVVSVSTSGITTPSLDALIGERMNLRRDVERLPVFGLGCVGGVIGLARAGQMATSRPGSNVLLLVVELCGLTFRHNDHSKSNIIATALFGDGAAAAVLTTSEVATDSNPPGLSAWGEHTWSNTLNIMGWNVENDGLGVLFSPNIPNLVRKNYRAALDRFLAANDLSLGDIDKFAFHPGGAKVIDALEEGLGFDRGHLEESRAILSEFGNMSAATVLFVLARIMKNSGPSDRILVSSLGPGFTAGFLVLERT